MSGVPLGPYLAAIINETVRRIVGTHFLPRVRQPVSDNAEPRQSA